MKIQINCRKCRKIVENVIKIYCTKIVGNARKVYENFR